MDRKEAQAILLKEIERHLQTHSRDDIMVRAPKPGKNCWTYGEVYDSILNDVALECLEGENGKSRDIDLYIKYHNHESKN